MHVFYYLQEQINTYYNTLRCWVISCISLIYFTCVTCAITYKIEHLLWFQHCLSDYKNVWLFINNRFIIRTVFENGRYRWVIIQINIFLTLYSSLGKIFYNQYRLLYYNRLLSFLNYQWHGIKKVLQIIYFLYLT
jgi:hypothetical protein